MPHTSYTSPEIPSSRRRTPNAGVFTLVPLLVSAAVRPAAAQVTPAARPFTTTRTSLAPTDSVAPGSVTSKSRPGGQPNGTANTVRVPALDRSAGVAVAGDAPIRRTVPTGALAPTASWPQGAPPTPRLVSTRNPALTARERRAVGLSQRWIANREMPTHGAEGTVMFAFGATLPSIVCAPLYVCDVALQPGEVVNDVNTGDKDRWDVVPATSGAGAVQTTHVIIKPHDAGLATNVIVTTDRRTYVLKLLSRQADWMPRVAFTYPDDADRQWAAYRARQDAPRATGHEGASAAEGGGVLATGEALASLDFNFRVDGDRPRWRPVRVYTDGVKTYIQLPAAVATAEAPALVALGEDGGEQLVNYRMVGDRYVVDRVLDHAVLLTGVGRSQQRVEVTRGGGH